MIATPPARPARRVRDAVARRSGRARGRVPRSRAAVRCAGCGPLRHRGAADGRRGRILSVDAGWTRRCSEPLGACGQRHRGEQLRRAAGVRGRPAPAAQPRPRRRRIRHFRPRRGVVAVCRARGMKRSAEATVAAGAPRSTPGWARGRARARSPHRGDTPRGTPPGIPRGPRSAPPAAITAIDAFACGRSPAGGVRRPPAAVARMGLTGGS